VLGRLGDADGVLSFLAVPLLLQVDEPELDFESGVLPDLGLAFGLREETLGVAEDGVQVVGVAGAGAGILDATLGFLAFLVLIFSSSSDEGHGDTDTLP
jgi:hypothetical protein